MLAPVQGILDRVPNIAHKWRVRRSRSLVKLGFMGRRQAMLQVCADPPIDLSELRVRVLGDVSCLFFATPGTLLEKSNPRTARKHPVRPIWAVAAHSRCDYANPSVH